MKLPSTTHGCHDRPIAVTPSLVRTHDPLEYPSQSLGLGAWRDIFEKMLEAALALWPRPNSDTGGEFIKSMFCVGKDNVKSRYPRPSTNSPPVSLLGLPLDGATG